MSPELKKHIAEIPGEHGWWASSNQREYEAIAEDLLTLGVLESNIGEILASAYWVVASQYGDDQD